MRNLIGTSVVLGVVGSVVAAPPRSANHFKSNTDIERPWRVRGAFHVGEPVYAMDIGQLNATPAPELALLLESATVLSVDTTHGDWNAEFVAQGPLAIEQGFGHPIISIGDVDQSSPGDEIVANAGYTVLVGARDAADGMWSAQTAFHRESGMLWGARVADIDPAHTGDEIIVSWEGFLDSGFLSLLTSDGVGGWDERMVFGAEVMMDTAWADLDADNTGKELIAGTEMGPMYTVRTPDVIPDNEQQMWAATQVVNEHDLSAWVLEVGEVDTASPGAELIVGTRYGPGLWIARPSSGQVQPDVLLDPKFVSTISMADIAVADITPGAGNEIVAVDGLGRVHVFQRVNAGWSHRVIWTDPGGDRLHGVVVFDAVPELPGPEIVVAGNAGVVYVLGH